MLLGGTAVNALAFSGSNYLFSMLRSSGVDEERRRHDKAVEQLQAAHEQWSKQRTERLDWINEELRRQGHAVQTFHDVDMAIREYARVTGHNLDNTFGVMGSEPQITDFYTPSGDQKNREIAFVVVGLAATGLVAYKISKKSAKWSELTVPDCIGSSSPYGRYDISSEADNFPPDFLRHRYNDTTCQDGIAGRAILCYARGRPLRQPPQDSWSSGPHNDRYCTKVPRALAAGWESGNAFRHNGVGWSDQPPGNNWAAVRAGGFGMLETDRAGGILGI